MSNNKATEMIRTRKIYLTSDDVPDYGDVSNFTYTLRDPVYAQDGFSLVFGVTEIGFNATATNISGNQKNNSLKFIVEYLEPDYLVSSYNPSANQSTAFTFITNPNAGNVIEKEYIIYYPDGLYNTLDTDRKSVV